MLARKWHGGFTDSRRSTRRFTLAHQVTLSSSILPMAGLNVRSSAKRIPDQRVSRSSASRQTTSRSSNNIPAMPTLLRPPERDAR